MSPFRWATRISPAIVFAVLMTVSASTEASAQSSAPAEAGAAGFTQRPITRVLAVGALTAKATPQALQSVLLYEVPATLKLYLAGKIDSWYAKSSQAGVVFILNVTTVEEARSLLEPLPLGQAGMMTFEYTPLGPLQPLGLLLRQPAR